MAFWKKLLEPEEAVGSAWHDLVGEAVTCPRFPEAAVRLEELLEPLGFVFRALGGDRGITLRPASITVSHHRRSFRHRLGAEAEAFLRPRIDGDSLFLPPAIDVFASPKANRDLYIWLAAWAAAAESGVEPLPEDPLAADLVGMQRALLATQRAVACNPGLASIYRELCRHVLVTRPRRSLPEVEAAVEACIVELLGGPPSGLPASQEMLGALRRPEPVLGEWRAPKGYRRHLPVPVWGDVLPLPPRSGSRDDDPLPEEGATAAADDGKTRKGKREDAPDVDRNDPLILNRFEKILSWTEFLRVNRGVDDEDEEQAKRAADDHEHINLVRSQRRPATKLKFDLDLAPADVDRDHLSGRFLYPEWDYRRRDYLPDHCRVLASLAEDTGSADPWVPDAPTRRRIEAVRRQFEALRPRREIARRQVDGSELDMDALIRARCDLAARGDATDRVYQQARDAARDLAVAVLIDVSRSTEAYVENRQVLDIAKESLSALTLGLTACGDEHALYSFSSCKRDRVWVQTIKSFSEPADPGVLARIAHLRPGHYTRLGAAIRHVAAGLRDRPNQRRLLLVLTDGKPNDLDHYEGRYGVEDTAKAVREARRLGHAVFGITIDRKAHAYFPHMFGQNAFAIIAHIGALTRALPLIYRHMVG